MSVYVQMNHVVKFANVFDGQIFFQLSGAGANFSRYDKCLKMQIADKTEKRPMNAVSLADGFQFHILEDTLVELA